MLVLGLGSSKQTNKYFRSCSYFGPEVRGQYFSCHIARCSVLGVVLLWYFRIRGNSFITRSTLNEIVCLYKVLQSAAEVFGF